MSNQFTTQQIQAQYESLPEDIKQVVSSSDTATLIEEIGRKHDLRIDAIGVLIEYSTLIMLGLIKSNEFVSQLVKQLSISREQAEAIAVEIDSEVFSRIRNSLREVQYRPSSSARFEESDTILNTEARAPQIEASHAPQEKSEKSPAPQAATQTQETEEAPTPDMKENLSSQDYNPDEFSGGAVHTSPTPTASAEAPAEASTSPEPNEEDTLKQEAESTTNSATIKATPSNALDRFQETGFEENETDIPLRNNDPSARSRPAASEETIPQAQASAPEDTQQATPESQDASTPAPEASEENIKDFRTRLEERMASVDNSKVNSDPYKESI